VPIAPANLLTRSVCEADADFLVVSKTRFASYQFSTGVDLALKTWDGKTLNPAAFLVPIPFPSALSLKCPT
jgi:hypothetical protein